MSSPIFQKLFQSSRKSGRVPKRMLCLDPGHTTGWAYFEGSELIAAGTITTVVNDTPHWYELLDLLATKNPTCLVIENYRVYEHKLERHSFSEVHTLRIIGGIDLWAFCQEVPTIYQMASTGKGFTTDDKLRAFGFMHNNRHARDAIRHGVYALLFHNKEGNIPEKEEVNE